MADVTITLTVPDAAVTRVVHALCVSAGLPESNANAKQALIKHLKATVRNVEASESERAAVEALSEPDTTGIVT